MSSLRPPESAASLLARGRAHAERGELEEAERCYREAAALGDEKARRLLSELLEAEIVAAQEGASGAARGTATPAPAARAGWWRRAVAVSLDGLIGLLLAFAWMFVVVLAFAAAGVLDIEAERIEGGDVATHIAFWGVAVPGLIAAGLAPFAFMVRAGARNGQSLGKQALGIRVVRADGRAVTWRTFWLRELLYRYLLISTIGGLVVLPVVLNYLAPLWDSEDRAWHDSLARTRVHVAPR